MIVMLILLVILLLILGFPVFMSMIIPSFLTFIQYFPTREPDILIQQMIGGVNTFSLLAIPFFIFAADIIAKGEIGKRLVDFAHALVGYLPGGLAMATVVTCMFFGAIAGAGTAAVIAIGPIVYPMLKRNGYPTGFSIGLILTSSTLAMVIPPSIAMILYATVNPDASIRLIFAGGMVIGIVMGLVLMIYSYYIAQKHNIPRVKFVGFKSLLGSFGKAGWALGLPVIILGCIYSGITTVTEAAVLAVFYAMFVEMIIYRGMKLRDLYPVSIRSGTMIAMLLILIAAGQGLSYLMTTAGLPQLVSSFLGDYSYIVILIFINIVFLVAGMFIDPNSAIIILTPLVAPIAMQFGIDPLHLGLVIVFNLAIGMITPPIGLNIFIAQGVFKVPYLQIVSGIFPFIIITIIMLLLFTYIPELSLWLPNILR